MRCLAILSIGLAVSCSSHRTSSIPPAGARPPSDAPERFVLERPGSDLPIEPIPGKGCWNPLFDPRDGTQLTLVRSTAGQGDYKVSVGRYGVGQGEVLRIDCATGKPIGVFRVDAPFAAP